MAAADCLAAVTAAVNRYTSVSGGGTRMCITAAGRYGACYGREGREPEVVSLKATDLRPETVQEIIVHDEHVGSYGTVDSVRYISGRSSCLLS